ncbi:hypothetical protein DF016_36805 [Burkholderia stagnalis]|uniref:Uncharacterized protein n=1 Tax=Burkholderia stagnalis TaxID=1503054 RepID=A0ABX9YBL0_9BURK|nr:MULTISPECIES: hypothetical protein [Burkholderia]MDD1493952.1 hypothetical protein [Burkholderia thailandensis]RQY77408.1 hypothetical protein DF017_36850 [Burkholderia stagnalis]RQZ03750.1 hypothetical protein DF016_36805 [Burkholderia stagnalis]
MILVHVPLVLDVAPSEMPDAINELLRGLQARFAPDSCLIDYAVPSLASPIHTEPDTYTEGAAFVTI